MLDRIPVAQPKLSGNEEKYVMDCLHTTWISSNGEYISKFEQEFARFCQVRHAVATNNGTAALHLALVALGIQLGDEVIVPTVTYIATANAVRYCGGVPVLVDVEPGTMNIDPELIESKITTKTKGIIPVHLYGHPAEMKPIMELAKQYNLFVVEDAAEAHGAEYWGKRIGSIGDCATFSFFGNKVMTTGEGGMVTTNDDELAEKLRLYRGQGVDPNHRYWFLVVGYNYRMTNIQAAIGLAQMEAIDTALAQRNQLARWYDEALAPLSDQIVLPHTKSHVKHIFWMYNIFLKSGDEDKRNKVIRWLDDAGIETRPVFYPMHVMPPYFEDVPYPVADVWAHRGINLPTHQFMTPALVDRVAKTLAESLMAL
jgi:perosamine synthetase